ncbi:exodeoxyribonuclease VII large subunit [Paenisporosarcina quisquiliarum]|uniref:Exodeoxyribonuclease 7 large subunit n=1 Tax=Paenisporosarcina quisquiliarum TaxID=365346 RepID=A0A9X3RDL1_9BACL|nr:exodeoxyribonuclease VII large subunit [Paenisporosarcina quisquiliarum]MCZ8537960.1 exodeoxyribonuclease VII large subunit [Paenisporosarcina quisquiliarum]
MHVTATSYLTVKALTKYIKRKFDADPHLRNVYVKGELSNVKIHTSGHIYFTIKDDQTRMPAVMFAAQARSLKFRPESGMNVLLQGDVNVYEGSGQYQLYAQVMQPDGIGELFVAFEQLKEKLAKEGLFHPSRKKQIPKYPQKIGVITASTGAAIRDIVTTLSRRYPLAEVIIFPALVQGAGAAPSIVKALKRAHSYPNLDVCIVGRGGGSIEDLWAFNEEIVAREIANSTIPIISAVGHETDTTIADFVSDLRAPTPTAAAELAVPNQLDLLERVSNRKSQMVSIVTAILSQERKRLNRVVSAYPLAYPERLYRPFVERLTRANEQLEKNGRAILQQKQQQLAQQTMRLTLQNPQRMVLQHQKNVISYEQRLQLAAQKNVQAKGRSFSNMIQLLEALNPLKIMDRGYSLTYQNDQVVKSIEEINPTQPLHIKLQDGVVIASIESINKQSKGESS